MALLFLPFSSLSSSPPAAMAFFSSAFSPRFVGTSISLNLKFSYGFQIHAPLARNRGSVITVASNIVDVPVPEEGEDETDNKEESIPIQNLPLESKLQLQLEQKMKMKIAKKIRLRRKRLVRKRRMRKKGRWPPSKMKKLKNV